MTYLRNVCKWAGGVAILLLLWGYGVEAQTVELIDIEVEIERTGSSSDYRLIPDGVALEGDRVTVLPVVRATGTGEVAPFEVQVFFKELISGYSGRIGTEWVPPLDADASEVSRPGVQWPDEKLSRGIYQLSAYAPGLVGDVTVRVAVAANGTWLVFVEDPKVASGEDVDPSLETLSPYVFSLAACLNGTDIKGSIFANRFSLGVLNLGNSPISLHAADQTDQGSSGAEHVELALRYIQRDQPSQLGDLITNLFGVSSEIDPFKIRRVTISFSLDDMRPVGVTSLGGSVDVRFKLEAAEHLDVADSAEEDGSTAALAHAVHSPGEQGFHTVFTEFFLRTHPVLAECPVAGEQMQKDGDSVTIPPEIVGVRLHVALNRSDGQAEVQCYTTSTGSERWIWDLPSGASIAYMTGRETAEGGDRLFVVSDAGLAYALEEIERAGRGTGYEVEALWAVEGLDVGVSTFKPYVFEDASGADVVLFTAADSVEAVDATTGVTRWTISGIRPMGKPVHMESQDAIFVWIPTDTRIRVFRDSSSAATEIAVPNTDFAVSTPLVFAGPVADAAELGEEISRRVFFGRSDGSIGVTGVSGGTRLWSGLLGGAAVTSILAVETGTNAIEPGEFNDTEIYVTTSAGVHWLAWEGGADGTFVHQRLAAQAPPFGDADEEAFFGVARQPVLHHDGESILAILMTTDAGELRAFDRDLAGVLKVDVWDTYIDYSLDTAGQQMVTPVLVSELGLVFVGSSEGYVYVLDIPTRASDFVQE